MQYNSAWQEEYDNTLEMKCFRTYEIGNQLLNPPPGILMSASL